MKTAFVETSAINYCSNNDINGKKLNDILLENGYLPGMGIYTIYELARCFISKASNETKRLFNIVKELNPTYISRSDHLHRMEIKKLIDGTPVNPFLKQNLLKELNQRVENYCNGLFDEKHKVFIEERQGFWNVCRKEIWTPINESTYRKTHQSFKDYLNKILNDIKTNSQKIFVLKEYLQRLIGIKLTDTNVIKLITEIKQFPALCTLIYSQLFLNFQTENSRAIPSEDRFTDSLQLIESSYCSAIVSHDQYLLSKLSKNLNPDIEPINIQNLVNSAI